MHIEKIIKKNKINITKATVILINPKFTNLILSFLKNKKIFEIPNYLKRINKVCNKTLLLLTVNKIDNKFDNFLWVNVPDSNLFFDKDEFLKFHKIWPVRWLNRNDGNDFDNFYVSENVERMKIQLNKIENKFNRIETENKFNRIDTENENCCATFCMIVDPSTNKILNLIHSHDKIFHPILDCISKTSISNTNNKNYLCTNFDIFLNHEPCHSCSFALVHGRIKRCFFLRSGCGSFTKIYLHMNKNFNHRFEVFQIKDDIEYK